MKVKLKTDFTGVPYIETNYPDSVILEINGIEIIIENAPNGFDMICDKNLFNLTPITGSRLRVKLAI